MPDGDTPSASDGYRLEDSLGFLVNQASKSIRRRFESELASRGLRLTAEQFGVLVHVWHQPGLHQKDLARILAKDKTTVARLAQSLESRGMVVRVPDASDKRRNRVDLTDVGHQAMEGLTAAARSVLGEAVRDVDPDDLSVCKDVLRAVHASLESWKTYNGEVKE